MPPNWLGTWRTLVWYVFKIILWGICVSISWNEMTLNLLKSSKKCGIIFAHEWVQGFWHINLNVFSVSDSQILLVWCDTLCKALHFKMGGSSELVCDCGGSNLIMGMSCTTLKLQFSIPVSYIVGARSFFGPKWVQIAMYLWHMIECIIVKVFQSCCVSLRSAVAAENVVTVGDGTGGANSSLHHHQRRIHLHQCWCIWYIIGPRPLC